MENIQVLDVVALMIDIPEVGLNRGQIGTVIASLAPNVFEVEFCQVSGRIYSLRPLTSEELLLLTT